MYDFKYCITSNLRKEIEQITEIQKVDEKNSSKQKNKILEKTSSNKPNHANNCFNGNSFNLNVFQSCI